MALEVLYCEKDKYGQYSANRYQFHHTQPIITANVLQDFINEANDSKDGNKQLHLFRQVSCKILYQFQRYLQTTNIVVRETDNKYSDLESLDRPERHHISSNNR